MGKEEDHHQLHYHSDTEAISREEVVVGSVPYSEPLNGPLNIEIIKRAKFNIPPKSQNDDETYVEVTLDVHEDSTVEIRNINSNFEDGPDCSFLSQSPRSGNIEKSVGVGASLIVRNASSKIKQEIKKLASFSKKPAHLGRLERTKSAAAYALKGLKFISMADGGAGWSTVEKRFDEITDSTSGLLPRARFCECIGMKESKEFAGALFNALARERNIQGDSICKDELKEFWEQISNQSFYARLQTFFDMVDKDADGRISEDEVREIITLSASANRLSNIQKRAEEYSRLIMEELDPENHGHIMIENLEMLLLEGSQSMQVGENKKLSKMLSQKLKPTLDTNPLRRWYRGTEYFLLDNWQRIWVITLWIGIMAGLFTYKFIQYRHRAAYQIMGTCVCMAKGAAETLKFNMALILLPVCRNTLTWLRNKTKLGVAVPFDDNLNFHMVIAVGIAIGVGIHSIAHLTCDFPRLLGASPGKWKLMVPFFGHHPSSYWHFVISIEGITGVVMVVLMAIAFTLAAPCFRRNKLKLPTFLKKLTGFNAFWYSHHLFVIVYMLLLVHGWYLYLTHIWYKKTTWMYLAIPVALYAGERMTRALRSSTEPVTIQKVVIYPGDVTAIRMSRPEGFRYKSGQYMFVNCAAVSPFEWHPFSITSAPGEDYLSVHIKALGDWTRQLRTVFSEVCHPPSIDKSGLLIAEFLQGNSQQNLPRVLIDGPYGAPAQEYQNYEVVLLVGLGIGATPMISIVKDIVHNIRAMEEEYNYSLENGTPLSPNAIKRKENFKTRRAYFYWVTREQGSFDWFKGVMNEVAELDHNHVIELHNYCTSVYEEGDARSALIAMIQSLNHAKNGVDIVSGTRVKSHFAKPNWRSVFKHVAVNHPNNARVGVFYCGAPTLTKELRHLALDFSHKTTTKFDFHKENF